VFDGISPFHVAVPCAVFGEDRSDAGVPRFELRICSIESTRTLRTSAGFTMRATHGVGGLAGAGTIIIPSWRDTAETPPARVLDELRRARRRGARVLGLCLGAFVVAAAGLLDERRATTHWNWCDDFARRFPRVRLDRDVLYVDDGEILTSAGTAAAIDCCLHLLRRDLGAEAASYVARRMVVPPHRQGGQAQYIEQPIVAAPGTDRFGQAMDWATRNLAHGITLDALSARALMSRRTFTRRFRQVTGTTVGQWLVSQRLSLARRMLETTDRSVERIAGEAGFGTPASLRQHFAANLGTTPLRYRREFRGVRAPASRGVR